MDLKPILWNVVLAVAPAAVGPVVASALFRRRPWALVLLLVWLLLLPNAPYLLSGRHHFFSLSTAGEFGTSFYETRWGIAFFPVRTGAFLLYAGFGLVMLTLATRPVHLALRERGCLTALLAPVFFSLLVQGVILGRIFRLNSWDAMLNPGGVLDAVGRLWTDPLLLSLSVGLGQLLWLGYLLTDLCLVGVTQRLLELRASRLATPPRGPQGAAAKVVERTEGGWEILDAATPRM